MFLTPYPWGSSLVISRISISQGIVLANTITLPSVALENTKIDLRVQSLTKSGLEKLYENKYLEPVMGI
jgi:hypothetical protein